MNKVVKNTILVFIGIICLYESGLGIWQIVGSRLNIISEGFCTGTFPNPGPYGGFLAICACTLGAYTIDKNNSSHIRLFASICTVAALIILPSTQSRAAILALFCAATPAVVLNPKSRYYLKKYWIVLSVSVVVLTAIAYNLKRPSADGRFFMDKICLKAMHDNGWKGVGFGSFGKAYGKAQHDYFKQQIERNGKDELDWSVIDDHERLIADSPVYAFNEYLSIGVEAGAIVMLLFIGLIIIALVLSFRWHTIWRYGLIAFAVFAFFSYPLHIKELQALFLVLIVAGMLDAPQTDRGWLYRAGMTVVVILFVSLGSIVVMKYPELKDKRRIETEWKSTENLYKMECYDCVVERGKVLFPHKKNDQRFLFAYGQSLNKTGNYELSDSILKLGTMISADPMFWNVMGNNSMALGKYREAEERYKYAFQILPNRLYPLYLLAKLYYAEGDAARFIEMAEKVAGFVPKVESVNTKLLRSEIAELRINYNTEKEK